MRPGGSSPETYYHFPSEVLVIKGEVAYHYKWRSNRYSQLSLTWFAQGVTFSNLGDMSTWVGMRFVRHAAFAMASMRNRNGDRIEFEKSGDGWIAKWHTTQGDSGVSIDFDGTTIRYQGIANAPQFHLEGVAPVPPNAGAPLNGFNISSSQTGPTADKGYDGFRECEISAVVDDITQDQVSLVYNKAPVINGSTMTWCYPIRITFPGREITLKWDSYEYFRNRPETLNLSPDHYFWMNSPSYHDGYRYVPVFANGVTTLTDSDLLGAAPSRITYYRRQVPIPDRRNLGYWLSTTFTVQTIHPDASSTITRYVEPPKDPFNPATADLGTKLQVLAFLKHQAAETRHFGAGVDSTSDFVPNPEPGTSVLKDLSQSLAYKVELFDRWDLHTPTNPTGDFTRGSVPFATRTRSWDALNRVLKTQEQAEWDPNHFGWRSIWRKSEVLAGPPSPVIEYAGLAMTGASVSYQNPENGVLQKEARTFESKPEAWILGRPTFEKNTIHADSTPGRAVSVVFPNSLPPTTTVYDDSIPMLDRVSEVQVGSPGLQLRTVYTYKGSTGMASAQVDTIRIDGPNQSLTGAVGADYFYDQPYGFLNKITRVGVGLSLGQTSDGLGRVTAQEDANHLNRVISWDGAGRLRNIQPPSPEAGQTFTPDVDSRGIVIEHGEQRTHLRYNAFGEVVLEQRSNDGNAWSSYRAFAYDGSGRKTGETVWMPGAGSETLASNLNLTLSQTNPKFIPGHWECGQEDEFGNCIKFRLWEPDSFVLGTIPGLMPGIGFHYDKFGREILRQDANGVQTATIYGERTKSVTTGTGPDATTTYFAFDAVGRLLKVVDAKNQVTTYAYDGAGRIIHVVQYSGSTGSGLDAVGTGAVQVRTWQYDSLGRNILLDQPESGVTYFTAFNVLGKPTRTVYGLPSGWRPGSPDVEDASASQVTNVRVVNSQYDSLGRPTNVVSLDNTVNQIFRYDEEDRELSKGKLTTAISGTATRELRYAGLNGRLSSSLIKIDGQTFPLNLAWRNDGLLESRTYPNSQMQTFQYDLAKELPNGSCYGLLGPTTIVYDPTHWGPSSITFPNNASSFMSYSADQTRLRTMSHTLPTGALQSWNYDYDSAGRLKSDGVDFYRYDELGRLAQVFVKDHPTGASASFGILQTFGYDAYGNRTNLHSWEIRNWVPGTTPPVTPVWLTLPGNRAASYDMTAAEKAEMAVSNRLPRTIGGVETGVGLNGYDAQGNLKDIQKIPGTSQEAVDSAVHMEYDALSRVIAMSRKENNETILEYYTYDDQGLRILVESYKGFKSDATLFKKQYRIYNEARQLVSEWEMVLE